MSVIYIEPNQPGAKVTFKERYGNYIGGKWVDPVNGIYFDNISPVNGKPFCSIPRSSAEGDEFNEQ